MEPSSTSQERYAATVTPVRILTAELLSIGTELTVGDTRDTNAGELARSLTGLGVRVDRITALPDRLELVADAFRTALTRADLVVSTGGLGPTPDDLTREAIADVVGESPVVDPALEDWLRSLWARRGMVFPEMNLKQAWLIPSATALANPAGTAPGWLVDRAGGGWIVALPGPPREMRPMWADEALPHLEAIGLGADVASTTFRLADIGESQVAELLGEAMLRRSNPQIATYARAEAVDVRVSAIGGADDDGTVRTAAEHVALAAGVVRERLARFIWAMGEQTWADAVGERLLARGWDLGVIEIGTAGQVCTLLGDVPWLVSDLSVRTDGEVTDREALLAKASRARRLGNDDVGLAVGLAVEARELEADMRVSVAVCTPDGDRYQDRMAFLGGSQGRARAALVAARVLFEALGSGGDALGSRANSGSGGDVAPGGEIEPAARP